MTHIPLRSLRPEWNHAARILLSAMCADVAQREPWPVGWYVGGNYAIPVNTEEGRRLAEVLYAAGHAAAGHMPFSPDRRPALDDTALAAEVIRLLGSPEAVLELDGAEVQPAAGPPIRSGGRGRPRPPTQQAPGASCPTRGRRRSRARTGSTPRSRWPRWRGSCSRGCGCDPLPPHHHRRVQRQRHPPGAPRRRSTPRPELRRPADR